MHERYKECLPKLKHIEELYAQPTKDNTANAALSRG